MEIQGERRKVRQMKGYNEKGNETKRTNKRKRERDRVCLERVSKIMGKIEGENGEIFN